jgi:hypothetical protein
LHRDLQPLSLRLQPMQLRVNLYIHLVSFYFVAQLIEYDKKFVIVGHQNAISYKEIFKLIKEDKLWLGYGFKGGAAHFINKHYEDYATAGDHKEGMIRVSGVHWFTNLDISKRHEDLILYKNYNPEEYPTYENLDAINIDKTKDIPVDYDGYMGVPITFLDKYNPEQFEIIGQGRQDLCPGMSTMTKNLSKITTKEVAQVHTMKATRFLAIMMRRARQ